MKYILGLLSGIGILVVIWIAYNQIYLKKNEIDTIVSRPKPLEKYSIENLSKKNPVGTEILITRLLQENEKYSSHLFEFSLDPTLSESKNTKKVSGQINLPLGEKKFPLILMLRGYVDQKLYKTGDGTRRAAEVFASNGFITIAPDFLGYADSDKESDNIFETRFQTYTTSMVLLNSFGSIKEWDGKNVFIWAHSNGGQIALTLLEITGSEIPTTLWAPVSKPFPYNVLYYSDEADDKGKLIRKKLAEFEDLYDTDKYSLTNYLDQIKAPIQIHQGTLDDSVPFWWSDALEKNLKKLAKKVNLYKHASGNHNMTPGWNEAVIQDLNFFNSNIVKVNKIN